MTKYKVLKDLPQNKKGTVINIKSGELNGMGWSLDFLVEEGFIKIEEENE